MQKLYLVVDLDHTMLNSARFVEVPPEEELYLAATYLGPAPASSSEVTTGT
jgi:RNA polymerase II C-terminal domain phosphatase-like 3/4